MDNGRALFPTEQRGRTVRGAPFLPNICPKLYGCTAGMTGYNENKPL